MRTRHLTLGVVRVKSPWNTWISTQLNHRLGASPPSKTAPTPNGSFLHSRMEVSPPICNSMTAIPLRTQTPSCYGNQTVQMDMTGGRQELHTDHLPAFLFLTYRIPIWTNAPQPPHAHRPARAHLSKRSPSNRFHPFMTMTIMRTTWILTKRWEKY